MSSPGNHTSVSFPPYPAPLRKKVTGIEPTEEETDLQRLEWDTGEESVEEVPGLEPAMETEAPVVEQQGALCPRHHTMLPYEWQLRVKSMGMWYSVGGWAQEALERLFSDPERTEVKVVYNENKFSIDFTTMQVHQSSVFDCARRLSSSTCPSVPFRTIYTYYYEDENHKWVKYNPNFVRSIEEGLREGYHEVQCSSFLFSYTLYLSESYQENVKTGTKRTMRARPVFQSPVEMMSQLWTLHNSESPTDCFNSYPTSYPKIWQLNNISPIFDSIPLKCEDKEFPCVYRCFHKTMKESKYVITEIYRIQNYFQWEKYTRKRSHMVQNWIGEANYIERHLFHGTEHSVVEAICNQNFDWRVCGKNATVYGKGSYFSTNAHYAHQFSKPSTNGHYFMFLAKVLVGRPAVGKSSFRRPPRLCPKDPASPLYDSCVSQAKDPDIFVIFDSDQYYPYFLIRYQKLSDVVNVD